MSPSKSTTSRTRTLPTPSAFSRDAEVMAATRSCTRFLNGHGPRSASEQLAAIPLDTEIDYYGVGGVVQELEREVASLLGKPAALFLPSGTMAQQIVLRVHAERRGAMSVAFHPACHLDSKEERGYQKLHDLLAIPVGATHEMLSLESLQKVHQPIGSLLIELPQRDLGGVLPTWSELNAQVKWARERGAAVHLDGARLWESTPYYKKSPAQIAALFDSVYVSFYKGLGGITGCCVAGEEDVIDEVSTWRTRHGGRLFGMWPYAASARTALAQRLPKMPTYYEHARKIAKALGDIPGVALLPETVQAPMFHLRLSVGVSELRSRALEIARQEKIMTFARPFASEGSSLQRIEFTVGDATLAFEPDEVRRLISLLVNPTKAPAKARAKKIPAAAKRPSR
ncbi:MAG TPA: beta-eliminating lyase-related protein [Acidimicrobiales bacterium]